MDLRVLGPLEVEHEGRLVRIRSGRPRALLVALVLRLDQRVSTDALIDLLWPTDPPRNSANALQILVSHVRKALPATDRGPAVIETVDRGYRLRAAAEQVDAYRLEQAAARAPTEPDPRFRLELLNRALAEWRGPPALELEGQPFAEADVARLQEVRLTLLEQRSEALLELGDTADAVVRLQELVAEDPLRERPSELLMTALYRQGRQAEALEVYDRARRTLLDELGLDPGPSLRETAQAVLRQSADLQRPPQGQRAVDAGTAHIDPPPGMESWRPLDRLIGRDEEVARLEGLMATRRLVTLTGPGGAGKTRLAAHLAAAGTEAVWWVDLSQATGDEGVLPAIGQATHVAVGAGQEVTVFAGRHAGHRGLLVLDTCERVRAVVSSVVEALLRACPEVRILTTSRQPLGAATELVWPVPPLSLPHPDAVSTAEVGRSAAVQLFLDRATSRRPDLALSTANAAAVARICLLLDGLPLAIELAAGHAASLAPAEMVRVLDDRLRILVDETRGDRQSTLRATIAWSHDQLRAEEARFFERLSVFAGPFSIDGALAVAGAGTGVDGVQVLLTLARQSLVASTGDRYRLLDTVRAFAEERLGVDPAERRGAQRRHAEWHLRLLAGGAPGAGGQGVEGWRGEFRGALLDLLAALSWCFSAGETILGARLLASLWWLWPREGVFEEASEWFPAARAAVDESSPLHAALLASAASYAISHGDLASAISDGRVAAQRLQTLGDRQGTARVLLALGIAHWGRGEHTVAAEVHDRASALFEEVHDSWGRALATVLRARTALDAGAPDAGERLDAAEGVARRSGDTHLLAAALVHRARAAVATADYPQAAALARESLHLNEAHGHREGWVGSLHTLGFASVGSGELEAAADAFGRALQAALALHHPGALAESLDGLTLVATAEGRWEDAAQLSARAELLRAEHGIRPSSTTAALLEEARSAVDAALDESVARRARQQGAALDLDQVLLRVTS
ncbi:MAG TPA: BTAD domain-containing putative transcriptional regulator [Nocardioidaceae bacterium]|nr:BTAD domain-containing putative transcriptional regulator [Nocardioidaceae bacterium]